MSEEEFVKEKMRQKVCKNSPELRNLERQLQTAYNRFILEAMITNNKVDRMQEKALDRQIADKEESLRVQEEMRLRMLQHEKQVMKHQVADVLKHQMLEKNLRLEEELKVSAIEAKELEERVKREKAEENRIALEMKNKRHRFREEQEKLYWYRNFLKDEDTKQNALVEQHVLEEMNKKLTADAEINAEREKRIAAAEKVKETLAARLQEEEQLKQEAEELTIKLLCAEREEKERIKEEQEVRLRLHLRQASKQSFDDVTKDRLCKVREEKDLEMMYFANLQRSLELEEMRQRQEDERRRSERVAVRADNYSLIQWKKERKRMARLESVAEDAAVVAEEVARCKIVEEEKLQLLKTIDPRILNLLPPGCLTEEDMINLNMVK